MGNRFPYQDAFYNENLVTPGGLVRNYFSGIQEAMNRTRKRFSDRDIFSKQTFIQFPNKVTQTESVNARNKREYSGNTRPI